MRIVISSILLLMMLGIGAVQAHSGGTDAFGCHQDRKTGVYHCH